MDGDPSVMEVVKVPKDGVMLEQVAEWRDWVDPVVLANHAVELGMYYNEATLSPEINNHGLTTLNEIKRSYFNLYRWQYFDRFGKQVTNQLGWQTNVSTRPLLCDYANACINYGNVLVPSRQLADEMMSFIKRYSSTGGEADEGCHDDCVMAWMISIFCLAHSHFTNSILQNIGTVKPVVEKETGRIALPDKWDHDFFKSLEHPPKGELFKGGDGWLNY